MNIIRTILAQSNPWNPLANQRMGILWAGGLCVLMGIMVAPEFRDAADHLEEAALFDRVDINHDPWPSIARLEGIGQNMSIRIIDYRTAMDGQGGFSNKFDLLRVKGIGEATLEGLEKDCYFGLKVTDKKEDKLYP